MLGLREYFQICASGFVGLSHREVLQVKRQGAEVVRLAFERDIPKIQVGLGGVQLYDTAADRKFMAVFSTAGQHFAVVRGGAITPDDYQNFAREAILRGEHALCSSRVFNPLTGNFLGKVSDVAKASHQFLSACGREKLQLIQAVQNGQGASPLSNFAMVQHRELSEIDAQYMNAEMFVLQLRKAMRDLYDDEYSFELMPD